MKRAFAAAAVSIGIIWACASGRPSRRIIGEECETTRKDCSYGLECRVPLAGEPRPTMLDGGPLPDAGPIQAAGPVSLPDGGVLKRCQYAFFADCSDEPGGPACLSGQKCREGKCTVMCASDAECGDSAICRIGVCQRKRGAASQCVDNRDCFWPESCFHGQCVVRTDAFRCNSDLDCPYGYRCLNGRCQ